MKMTFFKMYVCQDFYISILTNKQNFGAYSVLLRVKNETLQQLLSI